MKNIQVSRHGKQRIKERCGVGKSTAQRMCTLATSRGVERKNTKGQLRKWLDEKCDGNKPVYTFGDKAYLFSYDNILITVLQIPCDITRNMSKMYIKTAM